MRGKYQANVNADVDQSGKGKAPVEAEPSVTSGETERFSTHILVRRQFHVCIRCGNGWLGRRSFKGDSELPKRCSACRSKYWDKPYRRIVYAEDRRLKHNQPK